jgi:hypothetical protein
MINENECRMATFIETKTIEAIQRNSNDVHSNKTDGNKKATNNSGHDKGLRPDFNPSNLYMKYAKSKFATGPDMLVNCPKVPDIDPRNFCQLWIILHDECVEKQLWQFIAFKRKQKYWGQHMSNAWYKQRCGYQQIK